MFQIGDWRVLIAYLGLLSDLWCKAGRPRLGPLRQATAVGIQRHPFEVYFEKPETPLDGFEYTCQKFRAFRVAGPPQTRYGFRGLSSVVGVAKEKRFEQFTGFKSVCVEQTPIRTGTVLHDMRPLRSATRQTVPDQVNDRLEFAGHAVEK